MLILVIHKKYLLKKMSLQENKNVVLRFNKEFLEKGNTEILKEIVSDGFKNHTAPPGFPDDVTGLIQFAAVLHKGFPNIRVTILHQTAEGDLVSSLKILEGIHTGEIMGKAPTGKKVTITVLDMVRIKNKQYLDHWGKNDFAQIVQAL